jgi:hypothetical protein
MSQQRASFLKALLLLSGLIVFCVTMTAGLWPLTFHIINGVSWLPTTPGLHFGKRATVMSTRPFQPTESCLNESTSLELLVEPEKPSSSATILAFSPSGQPESFSVRQSLEDLALVLHARNPRGRVIEHRLYLDNEAAKDRRIFLTVTADQGSTRVYVAGHPLKSSRDFGLRCEDLTGVLILGNSPVVNRNWEGAMLGLALYNRALSPAEAAQHYEQWKQASGTILPQVLNSTSLYVFNESSGSAIYNRGNSGPNLYIPADYFILHKKFLEPFWQEFRLDRNYAEDIALNIAGFVPLGFCVGAILLLVFHARHALAYSVLFCLLASLTIEILQAFIPTRYSGTTDLFTNTLGGALGAAIALRLWSNSAVGKLR